MAKIKLSPSADAGQVLGVARAVAERHGYLWEQDSATSATASEGGKPIRNKAAAFRLRLRLQVEGDVLTLKQETTGAMYTGAADTPFFQVRIALQARKLRRAAAGALAESGLAA